MNRFIKKKRFLSGRFLVCFFLLFLVVGGFLAYQYIFLPQIHLVGKKSVVLAYQKKYSEKGFKASFLGNDVTKDVVVKGKVNSNKLGTYNIEYVVKEGFFKKKVVRTIVVKDLEKPKMNIDDRDIYLCPGDEIVPEKVEVSDNYDKDLSEHVENVISKERDAITYKVCDKSRNCESVTKKIIMERYGLLENEEKTQKKISKKLGISRSYVSRIEKRALTKLLREFIKNQRD